MKIGKSYKLSEFLDWTRRKLYIVLALAIIPVVLYQLLGQKWVALPWSLAVLLGTATSFIVGFKNAQTYNRTVEAQQVWTAIAGASRYWGTISRDFPTNPRSTKSLIYRHLAWLTVLRYELRSRRIWESVTGSANVEYRDKSYSVPETESGLEVELAKYLPDYELEQLAATKNKATRLINAQSMTIKDLSQARSWRRLTTRRCKRPSRICSISRARRSGSRTSLTPGSTRQSTRSSSGALPPCCPFASFANSIA
jgi:putative membrane protein